MEIRRLVDCLGEGQGEHYRQKLEELIGWYLLHYRHEDVRSLLKSCMVDHPAPLDAVRQRFEKARRGGFLQTHSAAAAEKARGSSEEVPEDLLPIVWFPPPPLGGLLQELARCISKVLDGPGIGEADVLTLLVEGWRGQLFKLQREKGSTLNAVELVNVLQQSAALAGDGGVEVRLPTVGGSGEATEQRGSDDGTDDTQAGDGE
ncbi:MAG: hypothetical protein KAY32_01685 [Candidatus Eisenbacteria sp.]|nr:hypothetical protein [Candidatus Eisenbacteria bacterium]